MSIKWYMYIIVGMVVFLASYHFIIPVLQVKVYMGQNIIFGDMTFFFKNCILLSFSYLKKHVYLWQTKNSKQEDSLTSVENVKF